MIGFELSDEQKALQETARRFAAEEIRPIAASCDQEGRFPTEIVKKAFELGLVNDEIPEEYGGGGLSIFDHCLVVEELAWGCMGINASITIGGLTSWPIRIAGTEEQKKEWFGRLTSEPILASYCVTEPEAGSDVAGMKSTAVKKGDDYVINGTKQWITAGGQCSFYVVFAHTDLSQKHKGMSAFVVDRDSPGLEVGKKEDMMGQRASDTRQITFTDVVVPAKNRLGAEGDAFKIAMTTFDRTRPGVAIGGVGVARAAMEHAIQYAKERKTFGVPIGSHQAISFMLSDMAMNVQAARLLSWESAWMADQGRRNSMNASFAKAFAADMAMKVTTDAVQVFGGYGYSKEYPVEKLMRDAKVLQIYEGTSQIQRIIIGRHLLGG